MSKNKIWLKKAPMKFLSSETIAHAVGLCWKNGKQYLEESRLLLNAKYYDRAAALAILGMEEVGKIELVGSTAFLKEEESERWNKFWTNFITHGPKQVRTLYVLLRRIFEKKGTIGFQEIIPVKVNEVGESPLINLETLKQKCLYVGYDELEQKFKFETITEDVAAHLIRLLEASVESYAECSDQNFCRKYIEEVKKETKEGDWVNVNAEKHYQFTKAIKDHFKQVGLEI